MAALGATGSKIEVVNTAEVQKVPQSSALSAQPLYDVDPARCLSPPKIALPELRARFEELTLPLTRMLYGAAMRWTGSPEDAADLVQETYLRAYRTFSNFRQGTNAKAWLFTIMRSVFANDYRKKQRTPQLVAVEEMEARWERENRAGRP